MTIPLLDAFVDWYCPNCGLTDRTPAKFPNRYHPCPKLVGTMVAPMLRAGTKAKVYTKEREDYVGDEIVQLFDGRPVMSLITERPDGLNDATVFAPTASMNARS